MAELLDFSYTRLTPAQIRAAGRTGVIRYVASGRPLVSATKPEVDTYRAAGLTFCGVWQHGDSRPLGGYPAGQHDARDAVAYCTGLGASPSDPVYFAVDFDVSAAQMPQVVAYFRGVASVLGWARTGAYGQYDVMAALVAATPIGLLWQTLAWSAGRWHPAATLHQYAIDQQLNGSAVDFDRSLTSYYGQWGTMPLKSSPRSGAPVLWIVLHTAEGAYDSDPGNPAVDAGSVDQLRNFFANPTTQASSHAGADDDHLSDGWVDYRNAAWTLRNGNSISDNLEMCGYAAWTRAQWLTHRPMVRNAARWAAGRCQARGIPPRRLTVAQVAARNITGIIDHNTYTQATGDGTHWDIGTGFPWDLFLTDVNQIMNGLTPEDTMPLIPADVDLMWNEPTPWPANADDIPHNAAAYPMRQWVVGGNLSAARALTVGLANTAAVARLSDQVKALAAGQAAILAAVAAIAPTAPVATGDLVGSVTMHLESTVPDPAPAPEEPVDRT